MDQALDVSEGWDRPAHPPSASPGAESEAYKTQQWEDVPFWAALGVIIQVWDACCNVEILKVGDSQGSDTIRGNMGSLREVQAVPMTRAVGSWLELEMTALIES